MADWTPGIDITDFIQGLTLSGDSYVSESGKVFLGNNVEIFFGTTEKTSGSYVSSSGKVFQPNNIDITGTPAFSQSNTGYVSQPIVIFLSDHRTVQLHALPPAGGDDAIPVIFGIFVNFSADPRWGYAPLHVVFTDLSIGTIEEYLWEFGDGETYFGSEPNHTYRDPGTYDVSLSIRIEGRWFSQTRYGYITVWDSERVVSRTNRSFSLGINESIEGIEFSENTGDDWVFPAAGVSPVKVWDTNNIAHMVVLDNNDGCFYDMLTRDGPDSTGLEKAWLDKIATDGNGGTAIVPKVRFGEDVGSREFYWLRIAVLHLFVHAIEDAFKGASGFNDEGIPDDLEITIRAYINGKLSAERTLTDIPITGDVHFDEMVEGHRIAIEAEANMGQHSIIGKFLKLIRTDKMIGSGVMTEDDYQDQFSTPSMWLTRGLPYIDRATGLELDSDEQDKITLDTGVDGQSNTAWSFTEAINLPSRTLSGASLLLWHQGLDTIEIGGEEITLADYNTSGLWTLSYATAITKTGPTVITPTGTGKVFDFRIVNSQLFSAAAIAYYYDNIVNHEGDVVLP